MASHQAVKCFQENSRNVALLSNLKKEASSTRKRESLQTIWNTRENREEIGKIRNTKDVERLINLPKSYWNSMANRKKFLDYVSTSLNIKKPSDWGAVKIREVNKLGGNSILCLYNRSLFSCLQSVYKDIEWKREWFQNLPKSYWNSLENCRKFLEEVAIKLNIKSPKDWGKVTTRQLSSLGGTTLLCNYDGSLFYCLQSIFEDIVWKKEWFQNIPELPKYYWKSADNCREFVDKFVARYGIQSTNDWRKVSRALLVKNGGNVGLLWTYNTQGLLLKYGGSMVSILESMYPLVQWNDLSKSYTEKLLLQSFKSSL